MNPIRDIKGEHASIKIILNAMKRLAVDMRLGKFIDSYRIVQIFDFLHTFTEHCHYEKEEKSLYPALLEYDVPWTVDTLNHLKSEHKQAQNYIKEIDTLFEDYLSGNTQVIDALAILMIRYVELELKHINTVDHVVLPLCERLFDAKKSKSIASEFVKIQDRSVGNLKHMEYYKLLSMLNAENDVLSERTY